MFYNILSTFQKITHKESDWLGHKITIKGVLHIIYVDYMTTSHKYLISKILILQPPWAKERSNDLNIVSNFNRWNKEMWEYVG